MVKQILFIPFILWGSLVTLAYSAPLADCAYSTVNAAVVAATPGDTIELPSCTNTDWGTSTLSIDKELTLTGQGYGSTSIINAKIAVNNTEGETITISNFKVTSASSYTIQISGGVKDFRITGMYLEATTGTVIGVLGYTHGLVDNNIIYNGSVITGHGAYIDQGNWTEAAVAFARDSALGTANTVVFEDNAFTKPSASSGTHHTIWGQDGASYVARCNSVYNTEFDVHGHCSGGGSREFEIYGNKITDNTNAPYNIRGGTGVIFSNVVDSANSHNTNMWEQQIAQGICSTVGLGSCGSGGCPCDTYPCLYQVGRGKNNTLDPIYIWGNDTNVVAHWPIGADEDCVTNCVESLSGYEDDWIQEDRDYYLDTTRPSYTPYTYPHPDRGLSTTTTCLTDTNSEADTGIAFWVSTFATGLPLIQPLP